MTAGGSGRGADRGSPTRYAIGAGVGARPRRPRPRITLAPTEELVVAREPNCPAAEAYLRLRSALLHESDGTPPRVIVVTSGMPQEGKSLTAVNLALAFAACGDERVLLVDGDLRRGGLARFLEPAPRAGLRELLEGKVPEEEALLEVSGTRLAVVPAGRPVANPVGLLSSGRMAGLLAEWRSRFQRVVVDTPPIVPFADAGILGELSDGVLLVARAGRTPKALIEQVVEEAGSVKLLGVVLNDWTGSLADRRTGYDSRYYSRYYGKGGR
ncbi:MAG: polysaccharide biosynthesis tyrosine autokinase [Acidobacteria bacterium]|nr:MAG: polysaccharide biosynthesis tyrosine autokinase [Acidobacteriota bacterium]